MEMATHNLCHPYNVCILPTVDILAKHAGRRKVAIRRGKDPYHHHDSSRALRNLQLDIQMVTSSRMLHRHQKLAIHVSQMSCSSRSTDSNQYSAFTCSSTSSQTTRPSNYRSSSSASDSRQQRAPFSTLQSPLLVHS